MRPASCLFSARTLPDAKANMTKAMQVNTGTRTRKVTAAILGPRVTEVSQSGLIAVRCGYEAGVPADSSSLADAASSSIADRQRPASARLWNVVDMMTPAPYWGNTHR